MNLSQIAAIFKELDEDENGVIDFDEFLRFVLKSEYQHARRI